jgi:phage tail-like protein
MAIVANPRKVFNFSLTIMGVPLEPFLFQKADLPDREIDVVEHGDTNYDVKTGGRNKVGTVVLEKLLRTTRSPESLYFWTWMDLIANPFMGGGLTPLAYWRTAILEEFAEDGLTVINRWELYGCWPFKINGQSQNRQSSDNTIEKIELSVNNVNKTL